MNDWNRIEKRLRSWKPRSPAAHLKERIFPTPVWTGPAQPVDRTTAPERVASWRWLAPAAALFLFVMFISGPDPTGFPSQQLVLASNRFPGENMQEAALAACLADAMHSPHNNCQQVTLEWTNRDHSLTTAAPESGTNSLAQ